MKNLHDINKNKPIIVMLNYSHDWDSTKKFDFNKFSEKLLTMEKEIKDYRITFDTATTVINNTVKFSSTPSNIVWPSFTIEEE